MSATPVFTTTTDGDGADAGCVQLGGGDDAADIIVFTGDDDGFLAVSALQPQNAAVLTLRHPIATMSAKTGEAEDDRQET